MAQRAEGPKSDEGVRVMGRTIGSKFKAQVGLGTLMLYNDDY